MSGTTTIRSQDEPTFLQPASWLLDCEFVEEHAAGLALGALEPDEAARLNAHISWCPGCAKLVHETRKATGYLPFLSAAAAPSASAKTKLFERIQQTQIDSPSVSDQLTRTLTIDASDPAFLADLDIAPADVAPSVIAQGRKRRNWELIAAPLAAVPLVVALAIVGGWALRTQGKLDDRAAQAQVLQTQNAELSERIDFLSSNLDTASTRRFDFESVDDSLKASAGGNVVALGDEAWANLSVWNLPTATKTYKVLIETKDGQLQQVAEFNVDENGDAHTELDLATPLDEYDSVHVQPVQVTGQSSSNDSWSDRDVLWMDLNTNLGAEDGTEASTLGN